MDVRTLEGPEAAAGARSFEGVYIDAEGNARSVVRGDGDDG